MPGWNWSYSGLPIERYLGSIALMGAMLDGRRRPNVPT